MQIYHLLTAALLTAAGPARAQSPWIPGGTPGIPGAPAPAPPAGDASSDPSGPTLVCQSSTLGQIALDGFTATRFCTRLVQCPADAAGPDAAQPVDTPNLDQDAQLQSRLVDCAGVCRCYVPAPSTTSSASPTPTPTAEPRRGGNGIFGSSPQAGEFRDRLLDVMGLLRAR